MKHLLSRQYLLLFFCSVLTACNTTRFISDEDVETHSQSELEQIFTESDVFSESLTGFVLYDPEADSVLHNRDGGRYYIPASNTKILTLYASLNALPDTFLLSDMRSGTTRSTFMVPAIRRS